MAATHLVIGPSAPALYLAFELGWNEWKLAFGTAPADNPRLRTIGARNLHALQQEIVKAKRRFGLPDDAPVFCCYEAGRDGFWLHHWLTARGMSNLVVDSASIEVKRRARRAKSDRLDAAKLLSMLLRYHGGEKKVWGVVSVPSVADEDRRHLHRDLLAVKAERTQHSNRIKGLLAAIGLAVEVNQAFPRTLDELRTWEGQPVPVGLRQRLLREFERWQLVSRQITDLKKEQMRTVRSGTEASVERVRKLAGLRGIGVNSAWLFVMECLGWRRFQNRRQVAALAGLAPTPYQSGDSAQEQGISKAGNRRLRTLLVEIAWCWLRYQPSSALSSWYQKRFGSGKSRLRRIGLVAVARKLLVQLWQYLEQGVAPPGAVLVAWQAKVSGCTRLAADG